MNKDNKIKLEIIMEPISDKRTFKAFIIDVIIGVLFLLLLFILFD